MEACRENGSLRRFTDDSVSPTQIDVYYIEIADLTSPESEIDGRGFQPHPDSKLVKAHAGLDLAKSNKNERLNFENFRDRGARRPPDTINTTMTTTCVSGVPLIEIFFFQGNIEMSAFEK